MKKILLIILLWSASSCGESSSNQSNNGGSGNTPLPIGGIVAGSEGGSGGEPHIQNPGGRGGAEQDLVQGGEGGNVAGHSGTGGTEPASANTGGSSGNEDTQGGLEHIEQDMGGAAGDEQGMQVQGGSGGAEQDLVQGGVGGTGGTEPDTSLLTQACEQSEASASICEVRQTEPGTVNILIENAFVTGVVDDSFLYDYGFLVHGIEIVFKEGFFVQIDQAGPGLFVEADLDLIDPLPTWGQQVSFRVTQTIEATALDGFSPAADAIYYKRATQIEDWQVIGQLDDLSHLETRLEPYHPNFEAQGELEDVVSGRRLEFSTLHKVISLDLGRTRNFGQAHTRHFTIATTVEHVRNEGLYRNCQKRFSQAPLWLTADGLRSHDIVIMMLHPTHFQYEDCDLPEISSAAVTHLVPEKRGTLVDVVFSERIVEETVTLENLEMQSADTGESFQIREIDFFNINAESNKTHVRLIVEGMGAGENVLIADEAIRGIHGENVRVENNRKSFEYNEPDLFISEILINPVGSDTAEFIEIYNPKSTPVRLADYALVIFDVELEEIDSRDTFVDEFRSFISLADDDLELPPYSVAVVTPIAGENGGFFWDLPDNTVRVSIGNDASDLITQPGAILLVKRSEAPFTDQLPLLDGRIFNEIGFRQFDFAGVEVEPGAFVQYVLPGPNASHKYISWDEKELSNHFRSSEIEVSSSVQGNLVYLPWKRFEDAEPSPGRTE